jgi:hypothetical protein
MAWYADIDKSMRYNRQWKLFETDNAAFIGSAKFIIFI